MWQGDWLAVAASLGAKPSGIDISQNAIQACQQRLPDGKFFTGPAESLPFADESFDIVTCLGSLEHFLDQPASLGEMMRVARPGAKLVILVPNAGFLTRRLGLYQGTQQQAIMETVRPLEEWRQMFLKAGMEVEMRWKDLHMVNRSWLMRPPAYMMPLRLIQVAALWIWPLEWQYQVYHLCHKPGSSMN